MTYNYVELSQEAVDSPHRDTSVTTLESKKEEIRCYNELYNAASHGNLMRCRKYVEMGLNLNDGSHSRYWQSALHFAAQFGQLAVVKLLVRNGATVDLKNEDGETALAGAIRQGHLKVCRYLIRKGASITDPISDRSAGLTALHCAIQSGQDRVCRHLIQAYRRRGLSLDVSDKQKSGPLHWAVRYNRLEIADLLKKNGASIYNKDGFNRTPYDVAVSRYNEKHLQKYEFLSNTCFT